MPHFEPLALGPKVPGTVRPVAIDPAGKIGPTRAQARGKRWRKTSHGFFVPAHVDGDRPEQRAVEAAVLLPEYGGLTGWAALRWAGGTWFDGLAQGGRSTRPVVLAVGGCNVRPQPGIWPSEERLAPEDLTVVGGLAVTTMVRSACYEMRYAATDRLAVVVLEMAAADDLVSIREMTTYASEHSGWTGIPRCRMALPVADENSWSPRETLMRLVWTEDGGLPRPLCNVPIFDLDGHHIGTPDLFDPETGVAGEYDGALHLEGSARAKDVKRESRFRDHLLEYVTMLAADNENPAGFVSRVLQAYRRAPAVSESRRTWTLERPSWWRDTSNVESRRGLSHEDRERLLRRRSA